MLPTPASPAQKEFVGEPAALIDTDAPRTSAPSAETRRVNHWRSLYELAYRHLEKTDEFGSNFAGWHDSYTGEPFGRAEMLEWRDATAARIRTLRPRRILEIGVGTGLLLSQLADEAEVYLGTDISEAALAGLSRHVAEDAGLAARVALRNQSATDFSGIEHNEYDLIILNSVIQYFPSLDYLRRVLASAIERLRPGGAVFLGDVRNLRLHRAFQTGVSATQLAKRTDPVVARDFIDRSVRRESELLIDHALFRTLRAEMSEVEVVDIRIKRGSHRNEMSAHRYDVVLHKRPARLSPPSRTLVSLSWREVGSLAALERRLADPALIELRLTGVPNGRVAHEVAAARLLDELAPVEQVLAALRTLDGSAPDPEDLYLLGERLNRSTAVTWADEHPDAVDVVFRNDRSPFAFAGETSACLPPTFANDPLGDAQ